MKQAESCIAALLFRDSARAALICEEGCFDYAQLGWRVECLQAFLSSQGVKPGMTIGCAIKYRLLSLLLLYALPGMGCIFMPLDPTLHKTRLRRFLQLGDADFLIAENTVIEFCPSLKPKDLMLSGVGEVVRYEFAAPLSSAQTHWLIATSGTEQDGKLVMLNGDQIMSSVQASRERLEFSESDSWLLCLPMFHIGGLIIPVRCAEVGAVLVLHETFDPLRLWEDMHKYEITHLSLVPAMLVRLLEQFAGQSPPAHLRVVLTGGGVLSPVLAQAALDAGWPLCPTYGMTETASQVATYYPPSSHYEVGLVGKPLAHLQVKIERRSGRIQVKGDSVMQGYAGQVGQPDDWFVTSDLGRLDSAGNLVVLGRADDVLISGGENVHPQQVEAVLADCPGIQDVAVTGIPDSMWGDKLVALYAGEPHSEAMHTWCRKRLPGFMRPKRFVRVDVLPRTHTGKLQRRILHELYTSKVNES